MSAEDATVAMLALSCPSCGKTYRLRRDRMPADQSAQAVRCKCGQAMPLSSAVPWAAAPDDAGPAPAAPAAPPALAPLKVTSIYAQAMASRKKVQHALDQGVVAYRPSPFLETYLPLGAMAVGLLIHLLLAPHLIPDTFSAAIYIPSVLALEVLVYLPCAFGAMLLMARFAGTDLGTLKNLAIRLAAVTLGPGALADALFAFVASGVHDYIYTPLIGLVPILICCAAPLGIIFGLSLGESALLAIMLYIPRLTAFVTLVLAAPKLFQ